MKTQDRESHYPALWNLSPLNILKDLPGKHNFQFSLWFNLSSLLSSQFELDPEADTIQPFLFEGNSPHLAVGGLTVLSQVLVFPTLGTLQLPLTLRHLSGPRLFLVSNPWIIASFLLCSLDTRSSYPGLHFTSLRLSCKEGNLAASPELPWPELCLIYRRNRSSLAFRKIHDDIKCKEGHSYTDSLVAKCTLVPRTHLE